MASASLPLFAIASFPWNIATQAALMFVMAALSSIAWTLFGSSLAPFDIARGGGFQRRHGRTAAGLALSGPHGR